MLPPKLMAALFILLVAFQLALPGQPVIQTPATGSLPQAGEPDEQSYPQATAVLWASGFLWAANETGLLTRWDVIGQTYKQYRLPGEPIISAMASDSQDIYLGTEEGSVWRLAGDGVPTRMVRGRSGRILALANSGDGGLWYAGNGLNFLDAGGKKKVFHFAAINEARFPLADITALAFDRKQAILWVGTRAAGLLGYDVDQDRWQKISAPAADQVIYDLALAPDSSIWVGQATGVAVYRNGGWENYNLVKGRAARSLAVAGNNTAWVAGDSYLAWLAPDQEWQVYRVNDNPLLLDRLRFVALDDQDRPWFIGRRGKVHFNGQTWVAYDTDVRRSASFIPFQPPAPFAPPPLDFPSPIDDYEGWLKTWPRPGSDNGRGMHFLQTHQFDPLEAQRQVNRLKQLEVRWALVHYAGHNQLVRIAPIFQEAGITVTWRPFVRPYERYDSWAEDVTFLRSRGLAPYFQLYNEPDLAQEWDNGQPVNREAYWPNLLSALRQVYDAGGYAGLQFTDPDWLRLTLQTLKVEGLGYTFDRLFFIPHLYGLNHPPEYDQDINGVLGFRQFAQIFEAEIGFVPVMIAGEGGWRPGEAQDNRYPAVSDELHRDYHLAVFDWFRTGILPDGQAVPDYFFAFCPWLISDPVDPAAWFDSGAGDRSLTIEAVRTLPTFKRKFSWEE